MVKHWKAKKQEIKKTDKEIENEINKEIKKAMRNKAMSNPILKNLMRIDEKRMKEEKKRLGLSVSKTVFTGVSVIAQMFWCEKKAFFDAQDEIKFYSAYVEDNKNYGSGLSEKKIDKILDPNYVNFVKIKGGHELIFLNKKVRLTEEDKGMFSKMTVRDYDPTKKTIMWEWFEGFVKKNKIKDHVVQLRDEKEERELYKFIKGAIFNVDDLSQNDMQRGVDHQIKYAEKYPSMRYHFRWNNYIIEAIPDGIGKDFCYEFKSTKKEEYVSNVKRIAAAQAHLYSYFFKKPKVRIQIYAMDADKKFTFEEKTDSKFAEEVLARFDKLMSGSLKIKSVQFWKCYKCAYRNKCDVTPLKRK